MSVPAVADVIAPGVTAEAITWSTACYPSISTSPSGKQAIFTHNVALQELFKDYHQSKYYSCKYYIYYYILMLYIISTLSMVFMYFLDQC